ncbi:MAG: hypothetical protein P4L49_16090 [Desulfosporosinus sp.]|nr:hypothetical protein [Desulfosporosinus sp.]
MNVYRYTTMGGKDLIADYLKSLPKDEQAEGQLIMTELEQKGLDYLKETLDTRQIEKKLWELNDPALKYRGSRLRLEVAITAEAV